MVVHNFQVLRATDSPSKTQAPLIIDPDAVLAFAVSLQGLQLVLRRYLQICQQCRPIEHRQLAHGHRFDVDPSLDTPAFKKAFAVFAFEAQNHGRMVTHRVGIVKRHLDRFIVSGCRPIGI